MTPCTPCFGTHISIVPSLFNRIQFLWQRLLAAIQAVWFKIFRRKDQTPPAPIQNEFSPLTLDPKYSQEQIIQLKPFERAAYAVQCQAGKLFRQGRVYDTTAQKKPHEPANDAFVLDLNEKMYAGSIKPGKFHHSSFLPGEKLAFAGELETNAEGKIVSLSNRSGHYKPQRVHLLRALAHFEKQGVDLSGVELREFRADQPNFLGIHRSALKYLQGKWQPDEQLTI